jgi:hypothetical protein
MAKLTLEMRVLQRAAEVLGSERALARRLRVPMPSLFAWIKGNDRPTRTVFLEAIDILVEHGDTSSLAGVAVKPPADAGARGIPGGKEDS